MIDPEDYPVTANRGYRHPPDDVGGVGVANDVPGDLARLAEDVDVDVQAVADAAAASVQTSRAISAGTGLSGGGDLSADRTLSIAAGGVTSGMIAAGAVGDAAISGGVAASKIAGTALVASTVDAKGDLLVGTAADTVGRLAAGANGDVLVASTGAPTGAAWRAQSAITSTATGVTLDRLVPVCAFTGGSVTATLPAAGAHSGVKFTIINQGTGTVTVSGISGLTIPGKGQVEVISTGSSWNVLSGRYSTNTVGLATYEWNHADNAWRLIAYDTGWRKATVANTDILNNSTYNTANPSTMVHLRRTAREVHFHFTTGAPNNFTTDYKQIIYLPGGFRPIADGPVISNWVTMFEGGAPRPSDKALYFTTSTTSQLLTGVGWATGSLYRGGTVWVADDALPSSLPGTQVTAPA